MNTESHSMPEHGDDDSSIKEEKGRSLLSDFSEKEIFSFARYTSVRVLMSLRCHKQDMQDQIQEAMLRIVKCLPDFKGESIGEFTIWVKKITASTYKNHMRDSRRMRRDVRRENLVTDLRNAEEYGDLTDSLFLDSQLTPPEEIISRESVGRIKDLLFKFDTKGYLRRKMEEASVEQIVTETGKSFAAVRGQMSQARAKIRKGLGEDPL